MWEQEALRRIRLAELETVLPWFPAGARVLEIGAGAGWQARALADKGFEVSAVEYAESGFRALRDNRVFPIVDYDGHTLPFGDGEFDVVFSSNVLEHIPHVREFQKEIRRVLAPDGIAIHLMPTATWRLWTTLAHYPYVLGRFGRRRGAKAAASADGAAAAEGAPTRRSLPSKLLWAAIPERHGEVGNFASELVHFSRWRWRRLFERTGFEIRAEVPTAIFYSGYCLSGGRWSLAARHRLGRVLGSSCRGWIVSLVGKRR